MKKLILITTLAALLAAPATAAGNTLQIRMKDPGCHWFYANGKYSLKYTAHGPVTIQNLDEATLKFVGPGGTKLEPVGKTLTVRRHGLYRITMVGQAPDDNHLKLTIN